MFGDKDVMDDHVVRAHCSYDLEEALEELQAINEMVLPGVEIDEAALDALDDREAGKFPNDIEPL